jgi:hypothetical protein
MPTVTIERFVTKQDTADALRQKLGARFQVTIQGHEEAALKVKQSVLSIATVHLDQTSSTSTFRISGGGLVISRLINEFGIAALEEASSLRRMVEDSRHHCGSSSDRSDRRWDVRYRAA